MVDVTAIEKEEPTQVELIRQFADGIGNSFAASKLYPNIDTALIRCHFKRRKKTEAENRAKELIEENRA